MKEAWDDLAKIIKNINDKIKREMI